MLTKRAVEKHINAIFMKLNLAGAPDVSSRVKAALLAMKGPEHAAVLKEIYGIDGFIEAGDGDYQPVRDAMALMNLKPPK